MDMLAASRTALAETRPSNRQERIYLDFSNSSNNELPIGLNLLSKWLSSMHFRIMVQSSSEVPGMWKSYVQGLDGNVWPMNVHYFRRSPWHCLASALER